MEYLKSIILIFLIVAVINLLIFSIKAEAETLHYSIESIQKISNISGGLDGILSPKDFFGHSITSMGDVNGDGVQDIAVGVPLDDDGGTNRGAVYILFMNRDGTVKSFQKISDTEGGFEGILRDGDEFGHEINTLRDIDGNGVNDLLVGSNFDDDGGTNRGAVYILFMNRDGTVKSFQKISDTEGGFEGILDDDDQFGHGITEIGDLNGDDIYDIVVGAHHDDDGGFDRGAVYILFMNRDGTVKSFQKISDTEGGFEGILDDDDRFGDVVNNIKDLDGDNIPDLAVGTLRDDDGGTNRGAVYILFMNRDGTVKSFQKISDTEGGFEGILDDDDRFGGGLKHIGDRNGDGVQDLAVAAHHDDDGGFGRGAFYILYMNRDGTVKSFQKISDTEGGFEGILDDNDRFGLRVANIGDLNDDGISDLVASAHLDDDGGNGSGSIWILFMTDLIEDDIVDSVQKISDIEGGFTGVIDDSDFFAKSVVTLGDLDNDGITDIGVGAYRDDDGEDDAGAFYILFMNRDGTVKSFQKISDTEGGFDGDLDPSDSFGYAAGGMGDLDNDSIPDLVVGADTDDDGGTNRGAVYILFMNRDGTVKSFQKISDTEGGFEGILDDDDRFGHSVNTIGDFNGDGIQDLAVGAIGDDDGERDAGALWILFLNIDGTVKDEQKISNDAGFSSGLNHSGILFSMGDNFGHSVNHIGDLDGDGIKDLAVGADRDDDGGIDRGAVYILFMNSDATVKSFQKISELHGNFTPNNIGGILNDSDHFGVALTQFDDLDRDGVMDIAVGAEEGVRNNYQSLSEDPVKYDIVEGDGAVYILLMNRDGTVKSTHKISNEEGGFSGGFGEKIRFGHTITNLGDLDGNGGMDLAVGSHRDDDGGLDRGAMWILFSKKDELQPSNKEQGLVLTKQTELSPLAQWNLGIPAENVICNYDLVLIKKKTSGQFACVKPQSAEKLLTRNWGTNIT